MRRYAAKLLLAWSRDPVTNSSRRAITEERIVVVNARSALTALRKANAVGKRAEIDFESGHTLRYEGLLQLLELGPSTEQGEVWWEFKRRSTSKARLRRLLPAENALWAFVDQASRTKPRAVRPTTSRGTVGQTPSNRRRNRA